MSNEVAIPDYLKAMMADGSVQDQTATMQSDSGGVPRLTTKGKRFRFKEGEEENVVQEDHVDVVIVGMNPEVGLAHTFYKDAYNPNSSEPPDCSSQNGVTPDGWIAAPQSDTCAGCPNQIWGSAKSMSGGKAKACRDSRQLMVARAKDFSEDPNSATLYLMQVTVNSLRAFSNFGKELAAAGYPSPQFVITRITMDDESSVPKIDFSILGPLNETMGKASWDRSQKKEWVLPTALPSGNNSHALPDPTHEQEVPAQSEASKPNLDDTNVDELIDKW